MGARRVTLCTIVRIHKYVVVPYEPGAGSISHCIDLLRARRSGDRITVGGGARFSLLAYGLLISCVML
jgi:hypothetical protein